MTQARFIAGTDPCVVFGLRFEPGEWTDVSALDRSLVERLSTNPTFEVREEPARMASRRKA